MVNQNTATVPNKVRGIAAERGLRQIDLAAILGLSRQAIVRRLRGDVVFTADELIALAAAMDVAVGAFFGEVASNSRAELKVAS
jgi:transcriptional regulator with XRE-family HTH domain